MALQLTAAQQTTYKMKMNCKSMCGQGFQQRKHKYNVRVARVCSGSAGIGQVLWYLHLPLDVTQGVLVDAYLVPELPCTK